MKNKILILLPAVLYGCMQLNAQTLNKSFSSTDGRVRTSIKSGNTIYIGGDFQNVGLGAKGLARFAPGSSTPDANYPQLAGNPYTNAMEPDGSGGYYAAGEFNNFNGTAITPTSIIHVLQNNQLDATFGTVTSDYDVSCLKKKGNTLYVGGYFMQLQGSDRTYVGALNATTGALQSWNPDAPDSYVFSIDVSDSLVFIQGQFSHVGGYNFPNQFAALKTSTGKVAPSFASANAAVTSMLVNKNTLWLGGNFSQISTNTAGVVKLNSSGANDINFPSTNGSVYAALADGSGGFFIGGSFTIVGNVSRSNLAHILSNGTVDPSFNATVNNNVLCLATDGTNLYFGGDFTTVNGTARNYGAAVTISSGALSAWNPNANAQIHCMVQVAGTIYLGGYFTTINGSSRNYAAAVTTANSLTGWQPNPDSYVFQILPNANGTSLFLCGFFTTLNGASRAHVARVNSSNGAAAGWAPNPNNTVYSIALNGSTLYIGGSFTSVNSVSKKYLAAVDTAGNNPTSFQADANSFVFAIGINAGKLYAGGYFTIIQTQNRDYIARIDIASGNGDSWSPSLNNGPVYSFAYSGNDVVAGGDFSKLNAVSSNHIGAINLSTNQPVNFNPATTLNNVSIFKLFINGADLFAGGYFDYTDGAKQVYNIIALDTASGNISHSFTQYPDDAVGLFAVYNNKLVIGGYFDQFTDVNTAQITNRQNMAAYSLNNYKLTTDVYNPNGNLRGLTTDASGSLIALGDFSLMKTVYRPYLAAIDATTGLVTSWNPSPNGSIYALAIKDSSLYAGGTFSNIGAQNRLNLASVSTITGKARSWNWDANSAVFALAVQDSTLYVGGDFTTIKNSNRSYAAAISTAGNGSLKSWNPSPDSRVFAIQPLFSAQGGDIFLGGNFNNVKGLTRYYLARVNNTNGNLKSWSPNANSPVQCFALSGNTLYVGGNGFTTISNKNRNALAAYDITTNTLKPFNAQLKKENFAPQVNALAVYGNQLYIGTYDLDSLHGKARGRLAAADTATGQATSFNPKPDDEVNSLTIANNLLYAGGNWQSLGSNVSPSYFAPFTLQAIVQAASISNEKSENAIAEKLNAMVYPNPANNECTVVFTAPAAGSFTIALTDALGKTILHTNVTAVAGKNSIQLNVGRFARGMYFISIINEASNRMVLKLNKE